MTYGNGRNASGGTTGPTVWRTEDYVYAIMVSLSWAPIACKLTIATGQWQTFDLTSVFATPQSVPPKDGKVDAADAHKTMAIAVDALGHVLVVGNLHTDPLTIARTVNPHDITAWTAGVPSVIAGSGDPANCTYPAFAAFSDGELWLKFSQEDVGGSSDGRDSVIYRLEAGETTWAPVGSGSGEIMTAVGNESVPAGPGEVNRRAYLYPGIVDRQDTYHIWGSWRLRRGPVLQPDLIYMKTADRGETWQNAQGVTVDVPLTYPDSLAAVQVTGGAANPANAGNLAVDWEGHIHGTYFFLYATDPVHFWWDGSQWNTESLASLGFTDLPVITFIREEIWYTGFKEGRLVSMNPSTGAMAIHGEVPGPAPITPTVSFPNGACYAPAPDHPMSGVATFFLPQGDLPRIYSLGNGPRYRVRS